ncbi:MAG: IPT/TIG domain-containing protein [Odoribacteraceae bacterium]|nr:IPT/TIG domain-containing protein [Odoribacteraceae bacterium]
MKKKAIFMISVAALAWLTACKDDGTESSSAAHDPSSPVTVDFFMPDSGRIREKVIIKGENFGNDLSKVEVYFVDALTERAATVIGVDNNTIYCLAPRQLDGKNAVKVVVHGKEVTAATRFGYTVAENVSTISGSASSTGLVDGTLATAKFSYIHGIAAIGNESVLVFQRDNASVRLVSVPDNAVVTVHNGFQAAGPAVTEDKTRVYAAGWNSPHVVYAYTKAAGWAPTRVGQLGTQFSGRIRGLALDANEEWLYFCDANGQFARFEIATQRVEMLNANTGAATSDGNYIIYNPFDGYFYAACANKFGIYKISPDGTEVIPYAGFNGAAVVNGYVDECAFAQPNGLALDEDGNIFVCDGFNAYVIRKISVINNYVSIVAGAINVAGQVDGNPMDARFNYPYDIANDGEGNYWIAEGWGCAVRRYAVE